MNEPYPGYTTIIEEQDELVAEAEKFPTHIFVSVLLNFGILTFVGRSKIGLMGTLRTTRERYLLHYTKQHKY